MYHFAKPGSGMCLGFDGGGEFKAEFMELCENMGLTYRNQVELGNLNPMLSWSAFIKSWVTVKIRASCMCDFETSVWWPIVFVTI